MIVGSTQEADIIDAVDSIPQGNCSPLLSSAPRFLDESREPLTKLLHDGCFISDGAQELTMHMCVFVLHRFATAVGDDDLRALKLVVVVHGPDSIALLVAEEPLPREVLEEAVLIEERVV